MSFGPSLAPQLGDRKKHSTEKDNSQIDYTFYRKDNSHIDTSMKKSTEKWDEKG